MAQPTIIIQNDAWKKAWPTARTDIRKAVKETLIYEDTDRPPPTVVLMDDENIRPLNHSYRGKDKATNVLSFTDDENPESLGDILLAFETIHKEAKEQHKDFTSHAVHLTVHGLLHLLGYDHEKQGEAAKMEKREVAILAILGVANPYRLT